VNFLSNPLVARLLWALPLLLLVIAIATTRAGFEQRAVAERGQTVQAEVTEVYLRERSEITHGELRLRYADPATGERVARAVELPLVLLKEIEADVDALGEGQTLTLPILVSAESDQIVLGTHPRGTWLLTFSLAGMALIGAVVAALLVGGWNRLLSRDGDPALRLADAA
jgi:hypothetical protein